MGYETPRERKLYELRAHRAGGRVRVDAQPVREHIERLSATASFSTIAAAAGVQQSTVSRIASSTYRTTSPGVAEAILAVGGVIGDGRRQVAALGTARRLQALRAIGWPLDALAQHVGVTPQALSLISSGGTTYVRAEIRDAVCDAYGRLSMTRPTPATAYERAGYDRAQRHARRMGWAPPLAWDDDAIDDPAARPDFGDTVDRTTAVADDVAFLLEHEPLLTSRELAARLGYADKSGVQNALKRAERADLLERLARNASITDHAATA